jgi:ribosome maturation factor RimP
MRLFRSSCRAYDAYSRYIGEEVVIFYEDVNRDRRKIYGKIIAIEANVIHLMREETGWKGCIDCNICKVGQISTLKGWNKNDDTD